MTTKRVDCWDCQNFVDVVLREEDNLFSGVKQRAKCKLGRRVMFRKFTNPNSPLSISGGGYFRYCPHFETKVGNNCYIK